MSWKKVTFAICCLLKAFQVTHALKKPFVYLTESHFQFVYNIIVNEEKVKMQPYAPSSNVGGERMHKRWPLNHHA